MHSLAWEKRFISLPELGSVHSPIACPVRLQVKPPSLLFSGWSAPRAYYRHIRDISSPTEFKLARTQTKAIQAYRSSPRCRLRHAKAHQDTPNHRLQATIMPCASPASIHASSLLILSLCVPPCVHLCEGTTFLGRHRFCPTSRRTPPYYMAHVLGLQICV